MILPDVNILLNAFSRKVPDQSRYRKWLEDVLNDWEAVALADPVLSGFLRIVTNPALMYLTPQEAALNFVMELRRHPNCVVVRPGERHWDLFVDLCQRASAVGNLIPDAYLAALAIESGSELITNDRDFARFPGLRWRPPFE